MRNGFTTGSCAAAAAKAAVWMLLSGRRKDEIRITTPAGILFCTEVQDISMDASYVSCGVRKDAGDDPDVTDQVLVLAKAEKLAGQNGEVVIEGGEGVGHVTRAGLDQPVGNAAINTVPRRMITENVKEVLSIFDCRDSIRITISVPGGAELARQTFNPRLGIEGGISIIGTSGIVEPMSVKALLETIRLELKQKKAEGERTVVAAPGNYGLDFLKREYGFDPERTVKCSNYIGDTIDMARECGFPELLFAGHIGKLIKLSGGIMNTHSQAADCRMELFALAALRCGAGTETADRIMACVSADEACSCILDAGIGEACFSYLSERIAHYLRIRSRDEIKVECIAFSNLHGVLVKTKGADKMLKESRL